jgi:hypothetical protein
LAVERNFLHGTSSGALLFNSSAFNVVKQEDAKRVDDDSKAEIAQVVCSLQNREECMACGS